METTTFSRFDRKYLLDAEQYRALLPAIGAFMERDKYDNYPVNSVYFDTPDFALVRASIEEPALKEKLRLRCYGTASADTKVFVELKKKINLRTYKRRISLPWSALEGFPQAGVNRSGRPQSAAETEILAEIAEFLQRYSVEPKVFIHYEREAFSGKAGGPELRLTFDKNIKFRAGSLRLDGSEDGDALLPPGMLILEVKTPDAVPEWLDRELESLGLSPVSFSKYENACRHIICLPGESGVAHLLVIQSRQQRGKRHA